MSAYDWLTLIWFVLLGVLICGYAILDGFDLGVGILHPWIGRTDRERRLIMNSIGPLWDGNEVWLVTFGGALFAAFPNAYATILPAFYELFFLLLLCLIGRAVSLEFRSKVHSDRWRSAWDGCFFLCSLTASIVLGMAAGNVMQGMAIGPQFQPVGNVLEKFNLYALLVGLLTASLFAMHGAIYLYMKTEGPLQQRVRSRILPLFFVFAGLYLVATLATWWSVPHATANINARPWMWIVPVLNVLAVLNIPRAMHLGRPGYAFFSSAMVIVAFAALFSVAIFPALVISTIDPAYSVTLENARSSQMTLQILLIMAAIGMPCVLAYTVVVYWIFRGKVQLDSNSY